MSPRLLLILPVLVFTASCQKESEVAPPLQKAGAGPAQMQNSPVPTQVPAAAQASAQEEKRAEAALALRAATSASADADTQAPRSGDAPLAKSALRMAVARMRGLGIHRITGAISFAELPDQAGVKVTGTLRGLKPGLHGFHVHEHAACGKDGTAAGGHFNPTGAPHGSLGAAGSHVGDMSNIVADQAGVARISLVLPAASLGKGPTSLVGRALLVHAGADDLSSQPAGDAGPRVACAIITGP